MTSLRLAILALVCGCLLAPAAPAQKSLAERGQEHWAFRPVRRPSVPTVKEPSWLQTPVDAFILARLDSSGLRPTPQADRRALLRRITLDLTGLPPTPEEQAGFLRDNSPLAYTKLVERLLASPAYGERWGRHWLDVARYAESNGYERDGTKPNAWRFRDYAIDALNRDLPYDQFVKEQIAGDELPGADSRTTIATTFLRLGTWDDEPANDAIDRYDQLDDVMGVTATAFLAQTIRCARCHDHFLEPYTQKDYYRLLAIFQPLRRPQSGRADLDRPVGNEQEVAAYKQAAERLQAERERVQKRLDQVSATVRQRLLDDNTRTPAEMRKLLQLDQSKRTPEQTAQVKRHLVKINKEVPAAFTSAEKAQFTEFQKKLAAIPLVPNTLPRAYIWYESGAKAPPTRVLRRGNTNLLGPFVEPGLPALLVPKPPPPPTPLKHSTGRRLWLANWVATSDNPLTARVIVNRVWQWHFGRGLVGTPSDFGLMGDRPSHPELLDWLADELVRSGWSIKHLHRLLLLSSTYQTSAQYDGPDAGRKLALFGRWRQRRLEAEAVRDSLLAVSGQLNRQMAGPSVTPALPTAVLATQSRPGLGWGKSTEQQSARRSVYVFAKRSLALPELELLDAPDSNSSCEQRPLSTTAPQALTFLNGDFTRRQAEHLAERLVREAGTEPREQVRLAFELALCRPARKDEIARVLSFLDQQAKQIEKDDRLAGKKSDVRRRALASFCLVILNCNEFFYPG